MAMTCQALYNSEFAKYFVTLKYSVFVILKGSVSVKLQNLSFCNINILFCVIEKELLLATLGNLVFATLKRSYFAASKY